MLLSRSERVKSVDFHPTEPWVLASLYNGNVYIWNYETQVHTFNSGLEQCKDQSHVTLFRLESRHWSKLLKLQMFLVRDLFG
jgi:WD40 repeat protein